MVLAHTSSNQSRAVLAAALSMLLCGCGDILTEAPPAGDDFESPFDGLSFALNASFLRGDENFERVFRVEDGLGPIFNNNACGSCHPGDGRATSDEVFLRISRGHDLAEDVGGPQLQTRSIPGVPAEALPSGVDASPRMAPPVFGVGLIEAIPVETIVAHADEGDADGDGISGRPNWVESPDFIPAREIGGGPGMQLGRFGRKASVSTLLLQVTAAYHQDMGITSDFMPVENPNPQHGGTAIGDTVPDPEIPASTVLDTTMYVRLLMPPARGPSTVETTRGEVLFEMIGCATCHVPVMTTGDSPVAQLRNVDAHLYSDMLLHDMGPELADNRPDGDASGTEWKTAPLWGTRLVADFTNGVAHYMHDGRTTDLGEAISLHGGEAAGVRQRFGELPSADRDALLAFVLSL